MYARVSFANYIKLTKILNESYTKVFLTEVLKWNECDCVIGREQVFSDFVVQEININSCYWVNDLRHLLALSHLLMNSLTTHNSFNECDYIT